MTRGLTASRVLFIACLLFCAHALAIRVFPAHAAMLSDWGLAGLPLCVLVASGVRFRAISSSARYLWFLLMAAMALWALGALLSNWEVLVANFPGTIASNSDFAYFLYGAPILLAISYPTAEQKGRLFHWLDSVQILVTVYLAYIALFAVVPFSAETIRPIPVSKLMNVYNAENLILAVAATLKAASCSAQQQERYFFRALAIFLWLYAIFVAFYNYESVVRNNVVPPYLNLLVDIPFLFLMCAALVPFTPGEQPSPGRRRTTLAVFIDNASPILYTFGLLVLGAAIVPTHFGIGTASILIALLVYGIRTITLQSRYAKSQEELQAARDRLEELSLIDSLTGIANRRRFDQTLEVEWNRAQRRQAPLALVMLDVDYFKNINDTYGHRRGDACLVEIADALRLNLPRSGDLLARYGGEEFAVILPDTDRQGAEQVAERMLATVLALQIENDTPIGRFVSISAGIAVCEVFGEGSSDALVDAADQALYRAKQEGRNRVEVFA